MKYVQYVYEFIILGNPLLLYAHLDSSVNIWVAFYSMKGPSSITNAHDTKSCK